MQNFTLTRRELLGLGAATLLSAGCGREILPDKDDALAGALSTEAASPNIVVFLSDTLRADHVGCYGYPVNTTPFVDSMARKGVVFEECYSLCSWTKPMMASLDCGVVPVVHQAVASQFAKDDMKTLGVQVLRDDFVTFSEIFEEKGYHAAWFLANVHMQQEYGFGRGFSHYRYLNGEDPADQMNAVLHHLANDANGPFLLFIHCIDPHGPYIPPEQVYEELHGRTIKQARADMGSGDQAVIDAWESYYMHAMAEGASRPDLDGLSSRGVDYLVSLYDAEIAHVDRQVQRLISFLERQGAMDDTYFIFTSDHGEAFGEHGMFYHGNNLYDEEIHVPLVISGPGLPEGARVPWTVGLIDLFATMVRFGGEKIPSYCQSRPLFTSEGNVAVTDDRTVYLEYDRYEEDPSYWKTGIITGPIKVMSENYNDDYIIFDREEDPEETVNLADGDTVSDPELREEAHLLDEKRDAMWELSEEFGPPEWSVTDEHYQEELRSLGYL